MLLCGLYRSHRVVHTVLRPSELGSAQLVETVWLNGFALIASGIWFHVNTTLRGVEDKVIFTLRDRPAKAHVRHSRGAGDNYAYIHCYTARRAWLLHLSYRAPLWHHVGLGCLGGATSIDEALPARPRDARHIPLSHHASSLCKGRGCRGHIVVYSKRRTPRRGGAGALCSSASPCREALSMLLGRLRVVAKMPAPVRSTRNSDPNTVCVGDGHVSTLARLLRT